MGLQASLADHIGTIPEATPSATPAPTTDPAPVATPTPEPTPGQPAPTENQPPVIKPLGVKDNQDDPQPKPEDGTPFTLAEGVAPDMVVGKTPEGKPITAAEVSQGYLRQADYTRKTQEMAEFRTRAEPAVEFVKSNWATIEGLNSSDPQVKLSTLLEIAKQNNIDVSGLSQQSNRERDPSGRFVAKAQPEVPGLINLDEWDPDDTAGYELAQRHNAAIERAQSTEQKLAAIESRLDQWQKGQETQQQRQQAQTEMTTFAQAWLDAGVQGVDVNGAMGLVGQPITPEIAMMAHHFQALLAHQLQAGQALQGSTPNELGNNPAPGASPAGTGLHEWIKKTTH